MSQLDDVDLMIIRVLQRSGRASNREVARQLGISESTVRARVKKLEAAGLFRLVVFRDPAAFGIKCFAYLQFEIEQKCVDHFAKLLFDRQEVVYVGVTLARYNIYAVAFSASRASFQRGLLKTMTKAEGVIHHRIFYETETLRYDYNWTI